MVVDKMTKTKTAKAKRRAASGASGTVDTLREQVRSMATDLSVIKKQAAMEQYFMVGKESKDTKEPKKVLDVKTNHPDLIRLLGGMGQRISLPEIKTRLAWGSSITSSSNTALTTVINVDPSLSAEFTNFVSLFDEVKVVGGVIHFDFVSSGGTPTFVDIALGYDPVNLGVYGSVAEVLVAQQNTGPLKLETAVATAVLNGPSVVNRTGYWNFPFEIPKGPSAVSTNSAAANQVVTGMWAATGQTPMIYGFIKPYIQGAGTSVVVTMYYYVVIDVLFRTRT